MDRNEREIIDDLFGRLDEAERRAGPRDGAAERLIRDHLARQPAAPYYMAQALVVQQEALARAQARIEQLEREGGGGFLGGLFGGGERNAAHARRSVVPPAGPARGPWSQPHAAGGGFLAGAAQTALGVAGGVLLADALGDLFTPDAAAAAEPDLPADDLAADDGFDTDLGLDDF
jgi:uncharacterized protein